MSPTPSQDWEKTESGSHLAGHDLLQPRVGHHHRIFCLRLCKVNLIINKNAQNSSMSQVSCGILCSREYSFNSCSHVRDCWSFLVRNHLFYKRFDFLKLLSRRGLYTMLAMGSFPVGIIALSVVASRIQVFTCLIMIFLTKNLSAGPVGQLLIFLILLHP